MSYTLVSQTVPSNHLIGKKGQNMKHHRSHYEFIYALVGTRHDIVAMFHPILEWKVASHCFFVQSGLKSLMAFFLKYIWRFCILLSCRNSSKIIVVWQSLNLTCGSKFSHAIHFRNNNVTYASTNHILVAYAWISHRMGLRHVRKVCG